MRTIQIFQVGSSSNKEQFRKDIEALTRSYLNIKNHFPNIPSGRIAVVGTEATKKIDIPEKFFRDSRYDIVARAVELIREENWRCYEFYLEPFQG